MLYNNLNEDEMKYPIEPALQPHYSFNEDEDYYEDDFDEYENDFDEEFEDLDDESNFEDYEDIDDDDDDEEEEEEEVVEEEEEEEEDDDDDYEYDDGLDYEEFEE